MKRCCQNKEKRSDILRAVLLSTLFILFAIPSWAIVGGWAPDFSLKDHAGATCRLADYQGQPLVLKIGTTWCPSCASQTKELQKALPQLQELGVAVIEIFVEDSPQAVAAYRDKHHLPADVKTCIDDGQVLKGYSVVSIPRVLMLDGQHVLRDGYLVPAKQLVETFKKLKD
ncbi:MAG: hypothetical protein C0624_01275 [Desulfuromonas sp.]|nr:MAG: hypothetical protein C0624_01275 [Desulfuromonas sp.]